MFTKYGEKGARNERMNERGHKSDGNLVKMASQVELGETGGLRGGNRREGRLMDPFCMPKGSKTLKLA